MKSIAEIEEGGLASIGYPNTPGNTAILANQQMDNQSGWEQSDISKFMIFVSSFKY